MELYYIIAVTDADRGEVMNALFREAGLPMILSMPGRGTAKNEHLAVYGLGETPKTVTCAVAGAQQAAQLTRAAKRRLFIDIPGNGILLTFRSRAWRAAKRSPISRTTAKQEGRRIWNSNTS